MNRKFRGNNRAKTSELLRHKAVLFYFRIIHRRHHHCPRNNNNNNNNNNELATDEEYNNKVKRRWSQKALHGRHPYDLSQQYVDIEASNKWLASADLFAETEGFLTTIQYQVIQKRNYRKYILKQPNTDELCRRC
jgi:hypothetical protein